MPSGTRAPWLLALLMVALVAGCKAHPAPDSGFLAEPQKLTAVNQWPFDRSYFGQDFDASKYDELMVAPVNTDYVMAQNMWEKASLVSVRDVKKDVQELADYARQTFIKAAQDDPKKHFKIVQKAGPRTLILETAMVQLVPSQAEMNAIGLVFWEASATQLVGKEVSKSEDAGRGVVAIEGRMRDGGSGKVLAMFADRERPKEALLNFKSLSWWSPAKSVFDDWAKETLEVLDAPRDGVVKPTGHFELLIW